MILRFSSAIAEPTGWPPAVKPWPSTPILLLSSAIGSNMRSFIMIADSGK